VTELGACACYTSEIYVLQVLCSFGCSTLHYLGAGTVELMKTVKKAIDPYNLFNPGKVLFHSFFSEGAK